MALYTFYPIHSDGLCETFHCIDLQSPGALRERAATILMAHPSAETVEVYDDHRKVMTGRRCADTDLVAA